MFTTHDVIIENSVLVQKENHCAKKSIRNVKTHFKNNAKNNDKIKT